VVEGRMKMNIIIVTACLAGVAHSKMCAAALTKEAERRGHTVWNEIQSDSSRTGKVTPEQIEQADVVLFAYAVAIMEKERFRGKKVLKVPIEKALRNVKGTMDKLEALAAE
jgi:fructose-specific phosphotransferase system component IIB